MPLPTPNLDDRKFQEILDEARRLIPKFCPKWTDHNLSDPGITLLELFAWMTESLLYRVNQVPEKIYIKFLEMIGLKLDPPRPARATMTFYLSAQQPVEVTIPEGTETATMRTETAPAVVFSTEAPLTIRPAIATLHTHRASLGERGWSHPDVTRLDLPEPIVLFPSPAMPHDAVYLTFQADHSHHVIAIAMGCKPAAGINPKDPPLVWEVWQGPLNRWVPCDVEQDGTGGFSADGEIILHCPKMEEFEIQGLRGYWLRCRIVEDHPSNSHYETSPEVERYFRVESRGGTVAARQAITVKDEIIGLSDGTPGQIFKLLNGPLLERNPRTDYLVVEVPGGEPEQWTEVRDFASSSANDKCFTLDNLDGTITFGPSLPQPDGSIFHFGAVPPKNGVLKFSRYQYGGGILGNVPRGAISVLKSAIPYVSSVTNHTPAIGGLDQQSVEDAKLRAAQYLRSSARAVTAEDFEFHAMQVAGVVRARCLAPASYPGDSTDIRPGQIFVVVLPQIESPEHPEPEQMVLKEDMRQKILDYLLARCVIGIGVEVVLPEIVWVSVEGEVLLPENSHPELVLETQVRAETELYKYLNPYTGGPQGIGWPFGRGLYYSEIYGLLQKIPFVEYVDNVLIKISEPGQTTPSRPAPQRMQIGKHALVCSAQHLIHVKQSRRQDQSRGSTP
jgi:predicted phage baseplate assembly protein